MSVFIDPKKTGRYRVKKIVNTILVFLGLKSRERARRELREIELEIRFVNAMAIAYREIAEKLLQSSDNSTEATINKDELEILSAPFRSEAPERE